MRKTLTQLELPGMDIPDKAIPACLDHWLAKHLEKEHATALPTTRQQKPKRAALPETDQENESRKPQRPAKRRLEALNYKCWWCGPCNSHHQLSVTRCANGNRRPR